ncbi:MAG: DUF3237 family protein [Propionibacteriales bacterium]|nr:DUF3237 family protein [Propionibacteriales bacterium]
MELAYTSDFHLVRPYGNESGIGWGIGDGTATGDRLSGDVRWSNQPRRRGDGVMLPNARGVITTGEDAEVFFDLTGRTVFVEKDGGTVGRQLLMTLFESEDERYAWLNNKVCMTEGAIDPERATSHFEVHICESDLV